MAVEIGRRGIGVQGKVEVVIPAVALADGLGGRAGGAVPGKGNAGGGEIRLHGVGQTIHPVFLGIPRHIEIALLRGGA